MATRGWMSRAARSDPHDLRVPCTVILRTPALLMRWSKTSGEVTRLDRRAARCEYQTGIYAAVSSVRPARVLLQSAEPERGHARVRERQRRLRTFGLGKAVTGATADPLKLLSHVQLRVVEADLLPGEPEQRVLADLCPADAPIELRGGVGSSFGVPCRMVTARPVSTQPPPECSPSVSCSRVRSLSTATQGQGEEAELPIPRVLARMSQELAADLLDLLADTQPRVHPRP